MNGIPPHEDSFCAKCSKRGRTCCQDTDIYVTTGDIMRIKAFTGWEHVFEYRSPADPSYLDQSDDPVWAAHVFQNRVSRRVLCRDSFFNCLFLKDSGCMLPLDVRPLVCRLHPYQYTAEGIKQTLAPGCPHGLVTPGQTLEKELNLSRTTAGEWHRRLYAEIIKEGRDENRIDL